jgi:hypothetical protein
MPITLAARATRSAPACAPAAQDLVVHGTGLAAADVQDQARDVLDVFDRQAGIDAALEAVAGIGGEVVAARTALHGLRPPEGGLDVDVARVVGHRGGVAAHDAGERLDLHVVGDDADLVVDRDRGAVQQLELLARDGPSGRRGRRGSCRGRRCATAGRTRTSRSSRCRPAR